MRPIRPAGATRAGLGGHAGEGVRAPPRGRWRGLVGSVGRRHPLALPHCLHLVQARTCREAILVDIDPETVAVEEVLDDGEAAGLVVDLSHHRVDQRPVVVLDTAQDVQFCTFDVDLEEVDAGDGVAAQ
jgi:hypothetical protein